jgi:GMP synthase (glutamine-hydrolysing)
MSPEPPVLLAVQHVSWESPHRILDACGRLGVRRVKPLAGDRLPGHAEVCGAVFMGGPMNVDEVERYPGLAAEREWLGEAVRLDLPVLGICLGAQLLARALGAEVRAGQGAEIGFAPVEIHDPADPVVGALAPRTTVLHWHGDVFDLPDGAVPLASSAKAELQAFRHGNAWGILFHPEADASLVDAWLAEPEMVEEARNVLGPDAPAELRREATGAQDLLIARSIPGFRAFAAGHGQPLHLTTGQILLIEDRRAVTGSELRRPEGIEPSLSRPQREVLPLNYGRHAGAQHIDRCFRILLAPSFRSPRGPGRQRRTDEREGDEKLWRI